jgi:hypothetical protein
MDVNSLDHRFADQGMTASRFHNIGRPTVEAKCRDGTSAKGSNQQSSGDLHDDGIGNQKVESMKMPIL